MTALSEALPPDSRDEPPVEQVSGVLEELLDSIKSWPLKNMEEMVDSTYRACLIGTAAAVGGLFGAPAIGAAIGGAMFGGKKLAEVIAKGLKDGPVS